MLNQNIYVPPHRRTVQHNIYVPPHRRGKNPSETLSETVKSENNSTANQSEQKNVHEKRHSRNLTSRISSDKSLQSSSNSESNESLVDLFSSFSIDESRNSPVIDCSKYSHILEISGFSLSETSTDIEKSFRDYAKPGFSLKWTDDSHCMIVFSSAAIAQSAISDATLLTRFRLNVIDNACRSTKWKLLKSPGDWALPYKCRPPILLNPSRRMIYHSLGIKPQITESQNLIEQKKIDDFKNNLLNDL